MVMPNILGIGPRIGKFRERKSSIGDDNTESLSFDGFFFHNELVSFICVVIYIFT